MTDVAVQAAVIAYALLLAETVYSYFFYVKKRTQQAYDRLITSVAVFAIAAPLMLIDLVTLAEGMLGVHKQYFNPTLTLDFGLKAQEAANRAIAAALSMSANLAFAQSLAVGAMWLAAVVAGIPALVVAAAANVGIGLVKGVTDVTLMIAQVFYAVGKLYEIFANLAHLGKLLTPLGLALLVPKRTRPLGAVLAAIGIGLGYIIPFALNSVAYQIKGITLEVPDISGVPSAVCIHVLSGGPLVNGTWVTAGFPAVVEYKDLDRPNRTVVHPVGCYSELTGRYKVTRVFVGAEPIKVDFTFTVKPLPPNVVAPFNSYDDMYLQKVAYPDLARLAELAGNNFTFILDHGPVWGTEEYYFAFWDPFTGYYAYIATDIFRLAPMNISTPWFTAHGIVYDRLTAVWYNYTYFPLWNPVMFADTWNDARKVYSFTRNMTIVKDGKNYTVTVNCTVTLGTAYGSVGEKIEVVDPGETEVNGTTLRPEVKIEMRPYYRWDAEAWFNFTRSTFNVWFNQSARVFNNTVIERSRVYIHLVRNATTIKKVDVIAIQGHATRIIQSYQNPHFAWTMPPSAPKVLVTATYCGRVVKPARVKMEVDGRLFSAYPVVPETILMLNYDPLVEPFAHDVPLTISFKEEARNFLFGVYPFLFSAGLTLTLAFFVMDGISTFLGGPSIAMRFILSSLRGAYWNLAIAKIGDVVSLLSGGKIPSIPLVGKYSLLVTRMNQELKKIREQMPLARLRQKAIEAVKSRLTVSNLERAESALRGLGGALARKTLAAFNLQVVERPLMMAGKTPILVERVLVKRAEKVRTVLVNPAEKLSQVKMVRKVPVDPTTAKPIKVLYVGPPKLPPIERQLLVTRLHNLAMAINEATYSRKPLLITRIVAGTMLDALLRRSSHTVDALLGAAAHRLREEAKRIAERAGVPVPYHPVSSMLLRAANYIELVRTLQNPYMIYSRVMFTTALYARFRAEPLGLDTKTYNELVRFNTDKAYLAAIVELNLPGYAPRAAELLDKYIEIYGMIIKEPSKMLEILRQHKDVIKEVRSLIHDAIDSELARHKVSYEVVKQIANINRLADEYISSLGTPYERSRFEEYRREVEKILPQLRGAGSELLRRYADSMEMEIKLIADIYSEERMRGFYELADVQLRAMGTAVGEVVKVFGEHDPRFREVYMRHSGDPVQLYRAFEQLVASLEPGVKEPVQDFVSKLEDYLFLKVSGAGEEELRETRDALMDAYRACLHALGLEAELYKLNIEAVDRAADAYGETLANFFSQLSLMIQRETAATPEERRRIEEEIEALRATSLVDMVLSGLMGEEELRERAKALPERERLFIEGAVSALSGGDFDALRSNEERMGYIYARVKAAPDALKDLPLPVGNWDDFLTGMQDAISAMANKEALSIEEVKAKALEQPERRDYWAGMYFAEVLVEHGRDEAALRLAEFYGAEVRRREAEIVEEARKREMLETQLSHTLSSIGGSIESIQERFDKAMKDLEAQGVEPGLSIAMSFANKEDVARTLETFYSLFAETKAEEARLNAARASLEHASDDLKDYANHLYTNLLSLEESIKTAIDQLRNILSSMEEEEQQRGAGG
jgi:hypothetical protein